MAISWIQPSFAGGEIGPSLYGRIDMAKYQVALRKCDNFIVRQYGGVENRPGTRFVGAAKYPNRKCRLIPFQFSTVQTYALEFGHLYMRVIKDGALVLNSSNVIYEIATPYTEADLFRIKFTQSADVLTLVHPAYPPKELRRYAHDNWQLVDVVTKNGPFEDINIDESVTVYASASTGTITLTASASIFGAEQVGKLFYLEQPAVDSVPVWETSKSTSIGDIRRADSNYYRAVTAGKTGTLRPSHTEGTSWDGWGGSGDDDTGIEWEYLHSGFGIARITAANGTTATAEVISYIPSQVVGEDNASYKWAKYAWNSVNGYPGTVVYYKQRLYFAASTAFPQTIWASRTGDYKDFGKSNPTQDDDRIIYTYAGRQVNEIRHLIDVGSLVALTSGGEYVITGDQNKVLTPSSFAFSSQGSNGSSNVPPIAVANIALFVQEKGSVVRDLAYSFDVDGYQGNDLTILANHLFQKHSIVDWCFSIVPYSSAFCIRDDGKLLVMTYLRDQQVFAWAPQSSTGKYESTCSISEGNEDAVYFVVNRTVNGQTVRYIERLSSRLFTSDEDAFFVDSGLSYDGRNTSDRTMTISGGSGEWDYRAEYTISVSGGAYFTSSDVGAQLQFPYTGETGEGYAARAALYDNVVSAANQVIKQRQSDPVQFSLASGQTKPIDMSNKDNFGQGVALRAAQVSDLAKSYGTPLTFFSKDEANQIGVFFRDAPVSQQAAYLDTIRQSTGGGQVYMSALQQISANAPSAAVAGILMDKPGGILAEKNWFNPDVSVSPETAAQTILAGAAARKGTDDAKGIPMPKDADLRLEFSDMVKDAFAGDAQGASMAYEIAKDYYAGVMAKKGVVSGEIDNDVWKQAVNVATGGVHDYNGMGNVLLPWGMSAEQFDKQVNQAWNEQVVGSGIKTPPGQYGLQSYGDSQYLVKLGTGYLLKDDGSPVVLNLTQKRQRFSGDIPQ
ncbi:phage protein [Escherichia coli]|nr:hypothetical protein [Escherichia coli]SQJ58270.1 phage protein [Escherichia coli]SQR03256.1 phage protein [Escherichia coli]